MIDSMSEAVRQVIESYPVGHEFHGNELHKDVIRLYPHAKYQYTDTLMRMMRRHCRRQYISVDHNKSLYRKVEL
jgi:hypothetical protein